MADEDNVTFKNELSAVKAGISAGHINLSEGGSTTLDLNDISQAKKDLLATVELKRKARQIQVSTDDDEVKAYLRQLGEPICYFGEDAADRRDRLRTELAKIGEAGIREKEEARKRKREEDNEVWYHEGSDDLVQARRYLMRYSLPRAEQRLAKARLLLGTQTDAQRNAKMMDYHKTLRTTEIFIKQAADERPISFCSFSPDNSILATASWSGTCKLWTVPSCAQLSTLRGHIAPVACITWHPQATLADNCIDLVSSAHDGTIKLWSTANETPIADIEGHGHHRVSRVLFHPSGRFLGTCCHDFSWRLWDLEIRTEVLHQEGHSKPVYCLAFHPDGSLALSGGLDSFGRVWDLRTGRCVMFLEGHQMGLLGVDIAANGYHMVTASEDNSCKIWDLRQRVCLYTIPAHTSIVSGVKFQPNENSFLVTSSYDHSIKLWGHPLWTPIKTLSGHKDKVMCVDITSDSKYIVSSSYDKSFNLWTKDDHDL